MGPDLLKKLCPFISVEGDFLPEIYGYRKEKNGMIQDFMVLESPGRNKESEKCWKDTVKGRLLEDI